MRSAYEAAMERLRQAGIEADFKLTKADKDKIKQITQKYEAQIAERKIVLEAEIQSAVEAGDAQSVVKFREQLTTEIADLQSKLERDKQAVIDAAKRRK